MVGTAPIFHEIRQNLFALREILVPSVSQIGREIWKVDIEKHLRPLMEPIFMNEHITALRVDHPYGILSV
jgi:hypothetical protein